MELDLSGQSLIAQHLVQYLQQLLQTLQSWVSSPGAWVQFALVVFAYLLAVAVAAKLGSGLRRVLAPAPEDDSPTARLRHAALLFLPLTLPLLAYVFAAIGESLVRSAFDSGEVIAFGKRVFLFLAARILVRDIISDPLLKLLGRYVLIPVAALHIVGLLDELAMVLHGMTIDLGNITFSVMALLRGVVAGGILFWLGRWSNDQSAQFIESQEHLRPSMRVLVAKLVEFLIFGIALLLLLNIIGINLGALAFIGGAVGVGLGFGLQKIASNFISGMILLIEGEATVGDYVELDGGEFGKIVRMTARAAVLETFDGRLIMVPNEDFITTRVVNYSHGVSPNRLEASFSVSYETDINTIPDIIEAAVATHPGVLSEPEGPDCELRGFGDSGIDFGVEFWVSGLDDGPNKYSSEVLFLIWNALKEHNIEIPFPQRQLRIRESTALLK